MPFISEALSSLILAHISDMSRHTTDLEKEFWNNKVSAFFNDSERENLVLSKTEYVIDGDIKFSN